MLLLAIHSSHYSNNQRLSPPARLKNRATNPELSQCSLQSHDGIIASVNQGGRDEVA